MRLIHVVPHIDQEAAGPSYSVPRLCQALAKQGHTVELSCLAARAIIPGVQLDIHREWPVMRRFAISTSHAHALGKKAWDVDVVHNHSLWSMVNVACGWMVPGKSAKLVTSPRGTLSKWALSRNQKIKKVLWPLQERALSRADLLHATSHVEYEEIRAAGFRAPVALIPNGIDLPVLPDNPITDARKRRTLLFLSRIHPTKGIDRLLQAWANLEARFPHWCLRIAGPGDAAHVAEVKDLARRLQLARVSFPGPLYGDEKSREYFQASLFVLPTYSENFVMVVAEALAHGCPAVVSRGAPWSGLQSEECGWWVSNEVTALTAALADAMSRPDNELGNMGIRGRNWMAREYGWDSIAERMSASYGWLLKRGDQPEWILKN